MILQALLVAAVILNSRYCEAERSYFKAAVFENVPFPSTKDMTHNEIMKANLKIMETAATEAAKRGVDILVTSEFGIHPPGARKDIKNFAVNIPNPQRKLVNPCNEKSTDEFEDALSSFSCIAKKNNMYVIANFLDIHPCSSDSQTCSAEDLNCEDAEKCMDGNQIYNTNTAFDRNGNLIARYHKNHLYFEFLETPKHPEMISFDTDFGKFGMIVCFDSVFEDAVHLVKSHNVETLLFPTYWFDDVLPFNTIEWQQSWAIGNNVNFFASNKHIPGNGTLGSGIYSKDFGALVYSYNPDGKSKLLISNVPRDGAKINFNSKIILIEDDEVLEIEEKGESFFEHCHVNLIGPPKDMLHDYRCYKFQTKQHILKKLEKSNDMIEACHNNFCCIVKYDADSMNENYYLTVFSGKNDVFDYFKWDEQTCLLVRCESFENKECAVFPSKSTTVFKSVEMMAKFKSNFVYPTVSKYNHRLAPKSEWTFKTENEYHILTFTSTALDPLLKVGLLSRNYKEDTPFVPYFKNLDQKPAFSVFG